MAASTCTIVMYAGYNDDACDERVPVGVMMISNLPAHSVVTAA